jgi:hypothetical protein
VDKTEKRFDVRVPISNTVLLEQLAQESELTGIVESRLIVQYATRYVQYSRNAPLPLTAPGTALSAHTAPNGQAEVQEGAIQPSLGSLALDTLFGDPD